MRKRSLIILSALLLVLLLTTVAFAAGGEKEVGIVVQFPDSVHTEIVKVPADATAADVLAASTLKVGMADTDFGKAICNINDVGSPTDNCFGDAEHFWAYYHLDPATNQWVSSEAGISNYTPEDKSVEGYAWSDFDADYNPKVQPPVKTFDEIKGASSSGGLFGLPWSTILIIVVVIVVVAAVIWYFVRGKK